jgi:hypothetical protein
VKIECPDLGAIFISCAPPLRHPIRHHARTFHMRLMRTLGIAGALVLSALVGGTLIGSAVAQDDGTDPDGAAYCDTFIDTFASELGATREELVAAGKAAATAALDEAVAAGDISEERAADIRERIDAYDAEGCAFGDAFRFGFGHGLGHGAARGFVGGDVLEAAADALGLESADLIERLDDEESLQAIAEAEGVSYDEVKAAVLAAVQADLDAAVGEGLDQARADAVIERLTEWLDNGGELGGFGPGGGGPFGPGRHFIGPWGGGDDAETDPDAEESGA